MTNPNETAYPRMRGFLDGLTKREYFAAMAMQGLCANPKVVRSDADASDKAWLSGVAQSAEWMTDLQIEKLNRDEAE